MRKTPLIALIILVLIISGCTLFKDRENPYVSFEVGGINEKDKQTPAVILIGDPQVSSRESLINDRMREVDHLEEMIRDSKEVSFEPQLKRDLSVIRALAAQLGISFNPASGSAFERQEDLAKLRTDVEIVKLRNELEKLKKLSQENPSDSALQPKTADQVEEKPEAKPGDPSVGEIKAQLNKAVKAADDLLKELQRKATGRAAETTIKASPEDEFEDLNAYRARLRQRQNEVRLDDVHDADGHALYRLQLNAAVLPSKFKNKFAVLDVGINPVAINEKELRILYNQWLAELSQNNLRLALSRSSGLSKARTIWERVKAELLNQGQVGNTFTKIYLPEERSLTFQLFIYPGEAPKKIERLLRYPYILGQAYHELSERRRKTENELRQLKDNIDKLDIEAKKLKDEYSKLSRQTTDKAIRRQKKIVDSWHQLREERDRIIEKRREIKIEKLTLSISVNTKDSCEIKASTRSQDLISSNFSDAINSYNEIYALAKSAIDFADSLSVIKEFSSLLRYEEKVKYQEKDSDIIVRKLNNWLEGILDVKRDAKRVLDLMESLIHGRVPKTCFSPKTEKVPLEFEKKVSSKSKSEEGYWLGEARTYQAQPTERVQRISSVASAVNSMQMALSLAALLPGQGIGLDAGAAAAKTAVGMVEAIERSPLVIGYTDRQPMDDSEQAIARFGYIFGPKAIFKTKENKLEYVQQARNHPVFADITVPAWWPAINLKVRSAWVENWYEGTRVLKNWDEKSVKDIPERPIRVRLRPRLADASALTQFILGSSIPSDLDAPRITEVYPERVSACAGDVVFMVAGENLWRAPVAYLRGKRHKSIRVLPDMRGLAVTFNMQSLPKPPDRGASKDAIIIWTSLGSEGKEIEILNTRLGAPCQATGSTGGVAASLEPYYSRIVGGVESKIRVNMAAPLPSAARNLRVIYQLFSNQGEALAVGRGNINVTEMFHGRFAEGSVTISKPTDLSSDAVNGAGLRVGVEYQTIDGGVFHPFWAERTMVFYVDDASSKFKVDQNKIDSLEKKIILTPPVKWDIGYPEFNSGEDNFVAVIEGQDSVKLKATANWEDNNHPGKAVVRVRFKNNDAKNAFFKIACSQATKLIISASDTSGRSPSIHNGTVTIAKQTRGCPKPEQS